MKKGTTIIVCLLIASAACRKSELSPPPDKETEQASIITEHMSTTDILSRKILASLGENSQEQFGSSDISINKIQEKQPAPNIQLYDVEYSVTNGHTGTALVVVEE